MRCGWMTLVSLACLAGSAVACISHLKQWALFFSMYTDEHGSYGSNGWVETNTRQGEHKHWKQRDVQGAGYIPLFLGANRLDGGPESS